MAHLDVGDLAKKLEAGHERVLVHGGWQVAHVQRGDWVRRLSSQAVTHQQAALPHAARESA